MHTTVFFMIPSQLSQTFQKRKFQISLFFGIRVYFEIILVRNPVAGNPKWQGKVLVFMRGFPDRKLLSVLWFVDGSICKNTQV